MSSDADDVVSLFRIHTAALAKQDWATITTRLHPNLTRNHIALTAEQYVNQAKEGFKAIPDLEVTLDQAFADKSGSFVFGRLIVRGTLKQEFMGIKPSGRPFEFSELTIYEYKDGKVFRILTATDKEAIKNQVESLPRTPFDTGYGYGLPEQTTGLKEKFTSSIEGITKGNVKEAVFKYCAPDVLFNGIQSITREEIIQQNLTIQDALTDLKVNFDGLVVDEDHQRVGSAYFVTGQVTKPFKNYLPGQIVQQYKYVIHFINEDGQLGAITSVVESEKAIDEGNEAAH
ncbi:SnoaL-like polyketide cyclase [Trichoderma harzianum]|uniref:SnoaL-like polyketide cyclase n=1 Tax=Trichoderma harzianum TaxID=5544 RepID=A0A0F9XZQ1_TRIHA|nr:SnoaL-like polyketide cyclase [Trichoderma harzianum]